MLLFIKRGLIFTLVALSFMAKAQDTLTINGSIDKVFDGRTLCLEPIYPYRSDSPEFSEESVIKEGKFSFSVPVKTLERYKIKFKGDRGPNVGNTFLLLPKKTEIIFQDTLSTYQVKGNDIHKEYWDSIVPLKDGKKYAPYEINKLVTSWLEAHPNSPLNTYVLYGLVEEVSDKEILRLYNLIPDSLTTNSYGKELKFIMDNLYVGKTAPDFTQVDTAGNKVSLSQFRGKYVLIDFWASWCTPCRAENPHLVEAMKKYGNKKIEIISVSFDDKREPWLAAIKKDGIGMWKHVSDLKGRENELSKIYRISPIPRNFLIDPDGKIIAKNLRGKNFLTELSKLIN
ncbi:TlpA disulfide reductase family protein [Pedobacter gandavensis]|uniref:Redoxin domain-containing protein n=1 Tax=Pedobacter gandavensis TaxID=2679963 RepID=A0ABR6EU05_9SPHI|nr:TlpA disulfide reductase family protein [Pedobacter gandavensis]MBB2148304.1 redoxin domain-containing protein [Pedobacter gandavensis]